MNLTADTLLIGVGNSGRSDDGIGWATLAQIQELGFRGTIEYRYQLNIEDAEMISHYRTVLIVDASQTDLPRGFKLEKVDPDATFTYSTHQVPPATVAYLCATIFDAHPEIYLLQIQGYCWELEENISKKAQENIGRAVASFQITGKTLEQ